MGGRDLLFYSRKRPRRGGGGSLVSGRGDRGEKEIARGGPLLRFSLSESDTIVEKVIKMKKNVPCLKKVTSGMFDKITRAEKGLQYFNIA